LRDEPVEGLADAVRRAVAHERCDLPPGERAGGAGEHDEYIALEAR
jgi:hypothetical protein